MEQVSTLLTSSEVAGRLRVHPATVNEWARVGRLDSIKTPGGQRRYRVADVEAIESGEPIETPEQSAAIVAANLARMGLSLGAA